MSNLYEPAAADDHNPGGLRPPPLSPGHLAEVARAAYRIGRCAGHGRPISSLFAGLRVVQQFSYVAGWRSAARQRRAGSGDPR